MTAPVTVRAAVAADVGAMAELFAAVAEERTGIATEPPVDAPYFVVKRYIPGVAQWAYYIERMDNRLWFGPEDPRCVEPEAETG